MKFPLNEYQRRSILPLAAIALAAYYLIVFVRLQRQAEKLDPDVEKARSRLAASLDQTNAPIDFLAISNQLAETKHARAVFEDARQKVGARIELAPAVRARLNAPFQLVDYENERSKEMDDLKQLAEKQKITVDPGVFAGFPEHTVDVKRPELLWASLSAVDGLLRTAIQTKVVAIHALETTSLTTNSLSMTSPDRLAELPVQVELTGPADTIWKLLGALPLRGDELHSSGFSDPPIEKPPLFIDRLILRKQSPEKPDEVRVLLRVVAFVMRDASPTLD
jgi:hypothetical protein